MLTSPGVPARTWALPTTWQTSPKSPPPHAHSQSFKDTPGSLLQTLALRDLPSWPHITASHMDTRCHSLIHAGVRAHTHDSHTHRLSHMRLLRTGMFSHMDTITHSEQSIFHLDTIAPPDSPHPPSDLQPHTPLQPAVGKSEIHTQNSDYIMGPRVAQAALGGRE